MLNGEEIKRREREVYDSLAEAYDSCLAGYNARFAADLVDMLYPQQRDAALDVAGGSGATGLKLADRIGPGGTVTIIDLSSEMLGLAEKKAAAQGLKNVRTGVMDAENLEFPDASFDIVTCSFGIMFFPDVPRAIAEMKRVLRPGGRMGCAVWSVPERFPMFSEPTAACLRRTAPYPIRLSLKVPGIQWRVLRKLLVSNGPTGFSPSRFCEEGSLERNLRRAGFDTVRRLLYAHPLEFATFDEYWETMMKSNPGAVSLKKVPGDVLAAVREDLNKRLVNPVTGAVRLFNEAAIVLAKKPL